MKIEKLKSVAKTITRGINILEAPEHDRISYYEVKISNFVGNSVQINEEDIQHNGRYTQISKKQLEKGDILIPLRRGPLTDNKIAIYDLEIDVPVIVSHHIFVIRPKQNIVLSYYLLFYFLNISDTMNTDKLNIMNNGVVSINAKYLQELEIPIPTLEEQQKCEEFYKVSNRMSRFMNYLNETKNNYCNNVAATLLDKDKFSADVGTNLDALTADIKYYMHQSEKVLDNINTLLEGGLVLIIQKNHYDSEELGEE